MVSGIYWGDLGMYPLQVKWTAVSPCCFSSWVFSLFFLGSLTKDLSISLVFSRNQLLISLIFLSYFVFPVSFISILIFISFILLALELVCSSFSGSLRCTVRYWSEVFIYLSIFIYLFMAALGLCCCTRAFFSCGKLGLLFVAVRGLLIVVASLVPDLGL